MWEFVLGAAIFFIGLIVGASLVYAVVGDLKEKPPRNDDNKD